MKASILILGTALIGSPAFAQLHSDSAPADLASDRITEHDVDGQARRYSIEEISGQLRELRRVVDETIPMLETFSEHGTNSPAPGQTTTAGALAGILGNVLGRTNQVSASESQGRTNSSWGSILRGVLGTNETATASSSTSTLGDLRLVRQHLQEIEPVLERLNSSTLADVNRAREDNQLTPTGREED